MGSQWCGIFSKCCQVAIAKRWGGNVGRESAGQTSAQHVMLDPVSVKLMH